MYMIFVELSKIMQLLAIARDREKATHKAFGAVLQQFYDEIVAAELERLGWTETHQFPYVTDDGEIVYTYTRKNGRQRKRVTAFDDTVDYDISLQRIRADSLHRSDTIYLSFMIPGVKPIAEDIARMILAKSPSEHKENNVHSNYAPQIIQRFQKKWETQWKAKLVEIAPDTVFITVPQIYDLMRLCVEKLHRCLFQTFGSCFTVPDAT